MAGFVNISGVEIPVATSSNPEMKDEIIGSKSKSYNGSWGDAVRNYRRKWDFSTTYLTRSKADVIRNLVQGKGHSFTFDNTLYSGKYLNGTFTRATARVGLLGNVVASGTESYSLGSSWSFYGTAIAGSRYSSDLSVFVEEGTTPLLGANTVLDTDDNADGKANGFTEYTGLGTGVGTLSMDTTEAIIGNLKCQKIVKTNDAANSKYGIQSAMVSCSTTSTASFLYYIEALGGTTPILRIKYDYYRSDGTTYDGSSTADLTATTSGWMYAYDSTYTSALAAYCQISVYIWHGTGTAYIQALQLENKSYSTSIHNTTTRNAEVLSYRPSMFNNYTNTFSVFVQPQLDATAITKSERTVWHARIDDNNYWKLTIGTDLVPIFTVAGDGGIATSHSKTNGTATSSTATTLVDSAKSWITDQWSSYTISITSGTGSGQTRTITENTDTTITVDSDWSVNPSTDSKYMIYYTAPTAISTTDWTMLTCVCNEYTASLYIDGVLERSFGINIPRGTIQSFHLGSDKDGANQVNALYDQMIVLPYSIEEDYVAFLYNKIRYYKPFYDLPFLELSGTFVNRSLDNPIICEGIFNGFSVKEGTGEPRYRVDFSLVEVVL